MRSKTDKEAPHLTGKSVTSLNFKKKSVKFRPFCKLVSFVSILGTKRSPSQDPVPDPALDLVLDLVLKNVTERVVGEGMCVYVLDKYAVAFFVLM